MATPRRSRFVHGVVAWQLAALLTLTLLGALELELFFVVSLIGFLVVTELTAPFNVTPEWRSRLKWLILLGLAVFGYVVVKRILEILPDALVDQLLPFLSTGPELIAGVVA
jgi:hypothetical protein